MARIFGNLALTLFLLLNLLGCVSRSGNGAHVWIFFVEPVPASQARQLGAAKVSRKFSWK